MQKHVFINNLLDHMLTELCTNYFTFTCQLWRKCVDFIDNLEKNDLCLISWYFVKSQTYKREIYCQNLMSSNKSRFYLHNDSKSQDQRELTSKLVHPHKEELFYC